MNSMPLLYWDACVFIYRIESIAPWSAKIENALLRCGAFRLAITDLTQEYFRH